MSRPGQVLAERALPGSRTGSDLVPGVPGRVVELADQLDAMARGLAQAGSLLRHGAGGGWQGAAAMAFAHLLQSVPQPYADAARVIGSAATAVRAHARVLAAAQQDADQAIALDLRAVALQRTTGPPSAGIVPPAIATAMQQRALALVAQARGRVQASAADAAAALRAAARAAPDQPNPLIRLIVGLAELQREMQLGAVESTMATVTAVALYSPNRALIDPHGWARDTAALGAGIGQVVQHPGDTVRAVVRGPKFWDNPGRAVGHLAPDVAIGVSTGGAGLVANRGVSVGVRAAGVAGARGSTGAEIRTATRTARASSRARLRTRDLRTWEEENDFTQVLSLTPAQHLVSAALARDAVWAEHDLSSRIGAAARSLGVQTRGAEHTIKTPPSLYRKVSDQVAASAGIETIIPRINDTVRYTLVAGPAVYVAKAGEAVGALQHQGMVLVAAKNFWGTNRYQGLNLTVADPRTGRLVEVQVHTPDSHQATVDTHRDYERFRQRGIPPEEKERLGARIGAVFDTVPPPARVGSLDEVLGRHPTTPATNVPPQLLSVHPWARAAAITGAAGGSSLPSGDDQR